MSCQYLHHLDTRQVEQCYRVGAKFATQVHKNKIKMETLTAKDFPDAIRSCTLLISSSVL